MRRKVRKIFVNQDEHEIDTHTISYARVVDLYLGEGGAPSREYLVEHPMALWRIRAAPSPRDTKVQVKNGMRFRVSGTGETLTPSSKILLSRDIIWISSTATLSFITCHISIKRDV